MLHPHRLLEYTQTYRTTCSGKCRKPIPKGDLRYGTKTEVMGHSSVTWRCINCITQRQAQNFISVARDHNETLENFLTVPPSISAGGDGPETIIVKTFCRYIKERARGSSKANGLKKELKRHHELAHDSNSKKTRKYVKNLMDSHYLDTQVEEDLKLLKLMSKPDLVALASHHNLTTAGTKPTLIKVLTEYYTNKPQARKKKKSAKK